MSQHCVTIVSLFVRRFFSAHKMAGTTQVLGMKQKKASEELTILCGQVTLMATKTVRGEDANPPPHSISSLPRQYPLLSGLAAPVHCLGASRTALVSGSTGRHGPLALLVSELPGDSDELSVLGT